VTGGTDADMSDVAPYLAHERRPHRLPSWAVRPSSEEDRAPTPADEVYSLRSFLTTLLTETLYGEPSVSFRLSGPGKAVIFGLSLPYTFRL
jgi:hypothetical protein